MIACYDVIDPEGFGILVLTDELSEPPRRWSLMSGATGHSASPEGWRAAPHWFEFRPFAGAGDSGIAVFIPPAVAVLLESGHLRLDCEMADGSRKTLDFYLRRDFLEAWPGPPDLPPEKLFDKPPEKPPEKPQAPAPPAEAPMISTPPAEAPPPPIAAAPVAADPPLAEAPSPWTAAAPPIPEAPAPSPALPPLAAMPKTRRSAPFEAPPPEPAPPPAPPPPRNPVLPWILGAAAIFAASAGYALLLDRGPILPSESASVSTPPLNFRAFREAQPPGRNRFLLMPDGALHAPPSSSASDAQLLRDRGGAALALIDAAAPTPVLRFRSGLTLVHRPEAGGFAVVQAPARQRALLPGDLLVAEEPAGPAFATPEAFFAFLVRRWDQAAVEIRLERRGQALRTELPLSVFRGGASE